MLPAYSSHLFLEYQTDSALTLDQSVLVLVMQCQRPKLNRGLVPARTSPSKVPGKCLSVGPPLTGDVLGVGFVGFVFAVLPHHLHKHD